MVLPESLKFLVDDLNNRIDGLVEECEDSKDEFLSDDVYKAREQDLLEILADTCMLVREETENKSPYLSELVQAAEDILSEAVEYGCGEGRIFELMPSWAHDDDAGQPLIKDNREKMLPMSTDALRQFIGMLQVPNPRAKMKEILKDMTPPPWKNTSKRHPKSTPLVRFRLDPPVLSPTPSEPLAMRIYDARCEVVSKTLPSPPMNMSFSQDNAFLAMTGTSGYKNRIPVLTFLDLNENEEGQKIGKNHSIQLGFAHPAREMALNDAHHLILLGDSQRIKTYAWAAPNGDRYKKPLPTHTLASGHASGPIAVLGNNTILRAGRGQIAVWNIEDLPTHGPDGMEMIGMENEDILENTWRDDPEEIEISSGSTPATHMKFASELDQPINRWIPLPQAPSTMLSHAEPYDCLTMDLEQQGKVSSRYLGHGGKITDLSVSEGDPQMFLTACHDGLARLYDLRTPLPVLTFDVGQRSDTCESALLIHPDGIPTVFAGTNRAEQIKMWDVRARTSVYELATGNNGVTSLAWDSSNNALYAATERNHYDYRYARKLREEPESSSSDENDSNTSLDDAEDDGEAVEDEQGDVFEDRRAWPKEAFHYEHYFGHMFDAGSHRIYRYSFKEDPDTSIVPRDGGARMGEFVLSLADSRV
ncbi:WD40 domain protein [Ceratobasidium sp. AG-Ba]|nr:WD40 domain protein [Ceratobasidium sp. AG-Ba]